MFDPIEVFEDEATGIKSLLVYDEDAGRFNPRVDFDNAWTLVGFYNSHREFGDEIIDPREMEEHGSEYCDEDGRLNITAYLVAEFDAHLIVPVHCYDHSLVSYYAGPAVTESWDTGLAGVAILSKAKLDGEWDGSEDAARKCLDSELETYTDWCNGTIYGFYTEDADGNQLDEACWGIYGFDYAKTEAKEALASEVQHAAKEAAEVSYWAARDVETVR